MPVLARPEPVLKNAQKCGGLARRRGGESSARFGLTRRAMANLHQIGAIMILAVEKCSKRRMERLVRGENHAFLRFA